MQNKREREADRQTQRSMKITDRQRQASSRRQRRNKWYLNFLCVSHCPVSELTIATKVLVTLFCSRIETDNITFPFRCCEEWSSDELTPTPIDYRWTAQQLFPSWQCTHGHTHCPHQQKPSTCPVSPPTPQKPTATVSWCRKRPSTSLATTPTTWSPFCRGNWRRTCCTSGFCHYWPSSVSSQTSSTVSSSSNRGWGTGSVCVCSGRCGVGCG